MSERLSLMTELFKVLYNILFVLSILHLFASLSLTANTKNALHQNYCKVADCNWNIMANSLMENVQSRLPSPTILVNLSDEGVALKHQVLSALFNSSDLSTDIVSLKLCFEGKLVTVNLENNDSCECKHCPLSEKPVINMLYFVKNIVHSLKTISESVQPVPRSEVSRLTKMLADENPSTAIITESPLLEVTSTYRNASSTGSAVDDTEVHSLSVDTSLVISEKSTNYSTSLLFSRYNLSSHYRLRTASDPPSGSTSSPFDAWYPNPNEDVTDCIDQWGHVWKYYGGDFGWQDEFGNRSPKGIRDLGTIDNPFLDVNGNKWRVAVNKTSCQKCSKCVEVYPGSTHKLEYGQVKPNCTCMPNTTAIALTTQKPTTQWLLKREQQHDQWGNLWTYHAEDKQWMDAYGHIAIMNSSSSVVTTTEGYRVGSYENPIIDAVSMYVWLYNTERKVFHMRNDHYHVLQCYPGWITQCLN